MMDKKELRRVMREQLAGLDRQGRASASAIICMQLLSLPEYRDSKTVFCFAGTKTEPNTLPILRWALERGKRVCLPRVLGNGVMEARCVTDVSELVPGAMGISEPPATAALVDPNEIDFAVLPCVAATAAGVRLGHGGGYYDRYLGGLACKTAIACFEMQLCAELPQEPHDVTAGIVVTEQRIYRH